MNLKMSRVFDKLVVSMDTTLKRGGKIIGDTSYVEVVLVKLGEEGMESVLMIRNAILPETLSVMNYDYLKRTRNSFVAPEEFSAFLIEKYMGAIGKMMPDSETEYVVLVGSKLNKEVAYKLKKSKPSLKVFAEVEGNLTEIL